MSRKKVALVVLVAFAVLGLLAFKTYSDAGELKTLPDNFPSTCTKVEGLAGAEDVTFHPTLGLAYVSVTDRHAEHRGEKVQGGIYRYDPRTKAPPVLLTSSFAQPFHPQRADHGQPRCELRDLPPVRIGGTERLFRQLGGIGGPEQSCRNRIGPQHLCAVGRPQPRRRCAGRMRR